MKNGKKIIEYVLLLLIVLIAGGTYLYGYQPLHEKAEALQKENKDTEARISELQTKIAMRPIYEDGIKTSDEVIDKVLEKYGPGNTPEKSIMFVSGIEDYVEAQASTIGFGADTVEYMSSMSDENGNPEIVMTESKLNITYTSSYQGLKDMMDYINANPERMNVDSFNAQFNQQTGGLAGTLVLNLYGIRAEGKTYVDPLIAGINLGTEDIFKCLDLTIVPEEGVEGAAGVEGAEGGAGAEGAAEGGAEGATE